MVWEHPVGDLGVRHGVVRTGERHLLDAPVAERLVAVAGSDRGRGRGRERIAQREPEGRQNQGEAHHEDRAHQGALRSAGSRQRRARLHRLEQEAKDLPRADQCDGGARHDDEAREHRARGEGGEQTGTEDAETPGQPALPRRRRLGNRVAGAAQPAEGLEVIEERGGRGGEEQSETSEQESPRGEPGEAGVPEPRQRSSGERILGEARNRDAPERQRGGHQEAGPEQDDTRPHQPVATVLGQGDPEPEQQGADHEEDPHQPGQLFAELPCVDDDLAAPAGVERRGNRLDLIGDPLGEPRARPFEYAPQQDADIRHREDDLPGAFGEEGPMRRARRGADQPAHRLGGGQSFGRPEDQRTHRRQVGALLEHRVGDPIGGEGRDARIGEARRRAVAEGHRVEDAPRERRADGAECHAGGAGHQDSSRRGGGGLEIARSSGAVAPSPIVASLACTRPFCCLSSDGSVHDDRGLAQRGSETQVDSAE